MSVIQLASSVKLSEFHSEDERLATVLITETATSLLNQFSLGILSFPGAVCRSVFHLHSLEHC